MDCSQYHILYQKYSKDFDEINQDFFDFLKNVEYKKAHDYFNLLSENFAQDIEKPLRTFVYEQFDARTRVVWDVPITYKENYQLLDSIAIGTIENISFIEVMSDGTVVAGSAGKADQNIPLKAVLKSLHLSENTLSIGTKFFNTKVSLKGDGISNKPIGQLFSSGQFVYGVVGTDNMIRSINVHENTFLTQTIPFDEVQGFSQIFGRSDEEIFVKGHKNIIKRYKKNQRGEYEYDDYFEVRQENPRGSIMYAMQLKNGNLAIIADEKLFIIDFDTKEILHEESFINTFFYGKPLYELENGGILFYGSDKKLSEIYQDPQMRTFRRRDYLGDVLKSLPGSFVLDYELLPDGSCIVIVHNGKFSLEECEYSIYHATAHPDVTKRDQPFQMRKLYSTDTEITKVKYLPDGRILYGDRSGFLNYLDGDIID